MRTRVEGRSIVSEEPRRISGDAKGQVQGIGGCRWQIDRVESTRPLTWHCASSRDSQESSKRHCAGREHRLDLAETTEKLQNRTFLLSKISHSFAQLSVWFSILQFCTVIDRTTRRTFYRAGYNIIANRRNTPNFSRFARTVSQSYYRQYVSRVSLQSVDVAKSVVGWNSTGLKSRPSVCYKFTRRVERWSHGLAKLYGGDSTSVALNGHLILSIVSKR